MPDGRLLLRIKDAPFERPILTRFASNDISLFHDLDAQRVLYACEGRKARVVAQFADALEAHGACAGNSCAVGYVGKLPGWRM